MVESQLNVVISTTATTTIDNLNKRELYAVLRKSASCRGTLMCVSAVYSERHSSVLCKGLSAQAETDSFCKALSRSHQSRLDTDMMCSHATMVGVV